MDLQQNDNNDPEMAYIASFEAKSRRQKTLLIGASLVITLIAAGIFYITIGSLGQLSAKVQSSFVDAPMQEEAEGK